MSASIRSWVAVTTVTPRLAPISRSDAANALGGHAVEFPSGLVCEYHRRTCHQCPGDGDALLFAAGQFIGTMAGTSEQADEFQGLVSARRRRSRQETPPICSGNSTFSKADKEGNQAEGLEDESDALPAQSDQFLFR